MYAAVKSNVLLRSHKGVAALFKPAAHVVQSGMPVFALLSLMHRGNARHTGWPDCLSPFR